MKPSSERAATTLPLAMVALVAPPLLSAHESPSLTFYNQAVSMAAWGVWALALAWLLGQTAAVRAPNHRPALAAIAVPLLCACMALLSPSLNHQPWGLAAMGASMSLAACLLIFLGWRSGLSSAGTDIFDTFCEGLAWAGLISVGLGLIQIFHPAWADGVYVAAPTMAGRAVANLRQPNHLATLLVWSGAAVVWLGARGRWPRGLAAAALVLLIGGVVLTASRTGMIGVALLTLWAVLDRRLPRVLRVTLLFSPLIFALWWGGMWLGSHLDHEVAFAAEARLNDGSDISSSRFKIWANVLSLIAAHPWAGVGYGQFNLAWTLSAFPARPVAFFDHTHNLVLQWAVEFGLPLTALLLSLGLWALWHVLRPRPPARPAQDSLAGAVIVMVLMVGVHSLLEYPLWYAYFLLPAAFALGLGLGHRSREDTVNAAWTSRPERAPEAPPGGAPLAALRVAGAAAVLMVTGTVWCVHDYQSAVRIYGPGPDAGPLEERIAQGQNSFWFAYQADYADVTGVEDHEPSRPPQAFARTLHNIVDARLMLAYARSLAEHDEVDRARYVIDRLREFRHAEAEPFLSACDVDADPSETHAAEVHPPFQCQPSVGTYTWRDLRP